MPELSRRTLVTAAAWSVPVVAVSTAAPAFAASIAGVRGFAAPNPVSNSQWFTVTVTNGNDAAAVSQLQLVTVPGGGTNDGYNFDQYADWTVRWESSLRTFVFTARAPLAPGDSVSVSFAYHLNASAGSGVDLMFQVYADGEQIQVPVYVAR